MDSILLRPEPHRRPLHIIRRTSPSHEIVLPPPCPLQGVPIDLPVLGTLFGGLHGGFRWAVDADLTGVQGVCQSGSEGVGFGREGEGVEEMQGMAGGEEKRVRRVFLISFVSLDLSDLSPTRWTHKEHRSRRLR